MCALTNCAKKTPPTRWKKNKKANARSLETSKTGLNELTSSRPCLKKKKYRMLLIKKDLNPLPLLRQRKEKKTTSFLQKSLNKG